MFRQIEAAARKKGEMSESGLHKTHQKLRQIMQDAYLNEIIPRNPVDLVPFRRPKAKEERKSLTPEEAARLFKCAEKEGRSAQAWALAAINDHGHIRTSACR